MAMLPAAGKYRLKLSQRSSLPSLTSLVEQQLKEPYIARFKDSCFDHLDEIPSNEELFFNVQGQKARMRGLNFALITGLSFGSYLRQLNRSDFCDHVFGVNHGAIKISDLEDKLMAFSLEEDEGETCLKLAMLYDVYGVLLGQSHSKKLDEKYIHSSDSFEALNNYPWGRVGFEFLKLRSHDVIEDRLIELNAYEVVPNVGGVFAKKILPNKTPRLGCRKTVDRLVTDEELRRKCFQVIAPGDEGIAILKLKPSKAESQTDYYRCFFKWKAEVSMIFEGSSDADRRKEVRKGKGKVAAEAENESEKRWKPSRVERDNLIVGTILKVKDEVREPRKMLEWQQSRIL
ncbi:hypothetical protein CASFOL_004747 [Castilleja foliolosa]|uniref:DUF1985 domain-containing protein n=1 Tax=Castilleja foliolosa TaxID=1961234 RepID=A0ABD3EF37_9LAMI